MREVVIVDGVRSPIGRFGGGLSGVRPDDLLAEVYKALMERTEVDPALLDDVYAGCGNQAGEDNRDVARMSLLLAGFPVEVPGVTVNRNCSSALEAVNQAAKAILVGEGDVFIGSGVESMSRAPWSMPKPERVPSFGPPPRYSTPPSAGASPTPGWTPCTPSSAWARPPRTSPTRWGSAARTRTPSPWRVNAGRWTPSTAGDSTTRSSPSRCPDARAIRCSSTPTNTPATGARTAVSSSTPRSTTWPGSSRRSARAAR